MDIVQKYNSFNTNTTIVRILQKLFSELEVYTIPS